MAMSTKIMTGKSTVSGKPTVKAGPSQKATIVRAKPGVSGKKGGC